METIKSKDNHVRKVKIMVIKDGMKKIYFRPHVVGSVNARKVE